MSSERGHAKSCGHLSWDEGGRADAPGPPASLRLTLTQVPIVLPEPHG